MALGHKRHLSVSNVNAAEDLLMVTVIADNTGGEKEGSSSTNKKPGKCRMRPWSSPATPSDVSCEAEASSYVICRAEAMAGAEIETPPTPALATA
eukprot:1142226-Pelagomonas_calceolata.AAC.4